MDRIGVLIGVFVMLTLLFGVIERLWPAVPGYTLVRKGFWTDTIYWLFTPLISRTIAFIAVGVAIGFALLFMGVRPNREAIQAFLTQRESFVSTWPIWAQALTILLVTDFVGYWCHRAFHSGWLGGFLWRIHAVHHSSEELNWLSSVRLHPLNDVFTRVVQVVPFFVLGFNPAVLAGIIPFLSFHAIMLHANVRWSFGPLRYVISSPTFHRWHHTSQDEGLDKNFAGLFPIWDLMFGTFHMPRGVQPLKFGVVGNDVPEGVIGQMLYPFRRKPAEKAA